MKSITKHIVAAAAAFVAVTGGAANANDTISLLNDITLNKMVTIGKDVTIDINKKKINLASGSSFYISDDNNKSYRVEFKNGEILSNTSGNNNCAFLLQKGSTLVFNNVEVTDVTNTVKHYFIWISDTGNISKTASLEINSSKFIDLNVVAGIYVGQTPSADDSEITVTIDNSTLSVKNSDNASAGIIAASPTNLTVTGNSTISGQAQAIILKSGKAKITNSTIATTYNGTWTNDTGAALQLTESFAGTVELSNVKLGTANAEHFGIYIATGGTSTITGSLTSDSVITITENSGHTITKDGNTGGYTVAKTVE